MKSATEGNLVQTTVVLVLFGFSLVAGFSKFSSTMDRIFLPHSFMVSVYEKVAPLISDIIKIPIDHVLLRKSVGYAEFAVALLLMRPAASAKRLGVFVLLVVMLFACFCHFLLKDPLGAYTVPATIGLNSLYLLLSLRDSPIAPLRKRD